MAQQPPNAAMTQWDEIVARQHTRWAIRARSPYVGPGARMCFHNANVHHIEAIAPLLSEFCCANLMPSGEPHPLFDSHDDTLQPQAGLS